MPKCPIFGLLLRAVNYLLDKTPGIKVMYVAPVEQKDRDAAWLATAVFLRISIPWNRITSYFPL